MTHTPDHDTPALAEDREPAVPRALVFHQIRMAVYRLAMTTTDGTRVASGRGFVTRPALLSDLRDAVRPNQGGTGAGGSAPSARIGFDAGAFDLYSEITAEIASAYESATDRDADNTPELLLLEWFIELEAMGRLKDGLSDAQLLTQRDRVLRWQTRIEDHFNPPRTADVPGAACIECGETTSYELLKVDDDGVEPLSSPLSAIYWTLSPLRGFHVHCRACGRTWSGEDLALLDRFRWAMRRQARINDLTTELTTDDWHHIRLDLREAAARRKDATDES
ncbi:hypothetical protein [Microbacterium maritypicum]